MFYHCCVQWKRIFTPQFNNYTVLTEPTILLTPLLFFGMFVMTSVFFIRCADFAIEQSIEHVVQMHCDLFQTSYLVYASVTAG